MTFERDAVAEDLNMLIPPEYLLKVQIQNTRHTVNYLPIRSARALADEVFGPGNWRCEVTRQGVDFEDQNAAGEHHVAAYCCVRITLADGTHREDVASGQSTNSDREEAEKNARAIAKANATKRTLRQFGNLLGNCLNMKEYAELAASAV